MNNAVVLSTALLVALLALPVAAADLTGSWDGRYVCQRNDGGEHSRQVDRDVEVKISQTGNLLRVTNRFGKQYNGVLVDDAARPESRGEVALARCTLGNRIRGADELGVLSAVVDAARGTGRMRGSSHQTAAIGIYLTCKWQLKRVDTTDPLVPPCP